MRALKLVVLALLALVPLFAFAQLVLARGEPTPFAVTAVGFGIAIPLCWLLPRFAGAVLVVSAVPLLGLMWFGISFGHSWSGEDWSAADVLILVVLPAVPLSLGALLFLAGSVAREYRLVRTRRQVASVIVAAGLALAAAAGAAVSLDQRGMHYAASPTWSPDGRWIAYAGSTLYSDVDRNYGGIYVLPADGGRERALTRTGWDDLAPAWSPDGSKIAFVRETWSKAFLVVVELRDRDLPSPRPGTRRHSGQLPTAPELVSRRAKDRVHGSGRPLGHLRGERRRNRPAKPHTQPDSRRPQSRLVTRRAPHRLRQCPLAR